MNGRVDECCSSSHPAAPCLTFILADNHDNDFDETVKVLSENICPVLLETIIQGDPRISSASIIWVSPDTNTWVRNPYKSSSGELALDIILEKEVVKQSGDAWRIVLDSCLPVFHLIDTRRSIPYAIKQTQELLGISCTFDQTIQPDLERVAASVKMVAKGVLREHLILLASSMTCGGNLVGFNTSGYKALSRQLNIQVPFTDATLFTPKKCFERAAEKCHTDSLSSIVASCSWGKPVAVGTGSKFDVVWDADKIKSSEIEGMDVYSFLHMVKGLTNGEEETDACLGEDIDDLLEEEYMDLDMSPPRNSGFEAVFEENPEVQNDSTTNGWDLNSDQTKSKTNEWSGWVSNKAEINVGGSESAQESSWGKAVIQDDTSKSNAWDRNTADQAKIKFNEWSAWGSNKSEIPAGGSENVKDSWGSSKMKDVTQKDSRNSNAWETNTTVQTNTKSTEWSAWGSNKSEIPAGGSKNVEDSWGSGKMKDDAQIDNAWCANTTGLTKTKSNEWSGWEKNNSEIPAGGSENMQDSWGFGKRKDVTQEVNSGSGSWGGNGRDQTKTKSNEWSGWGKNKSEIPSGGSENMQDYWGSGKRKDVTQVDNPGSGAWDGNRRDHTKTKSNDWSGWGGNKSEIPASGSENVQEDSWGSAKLKDVTQKENSWSSAWGANKTGQTITEVNEWAVNKVETIDAGSEKPQEDSWNSGNWKSESKVGNTSWGKPNSSGSQSWDSHNQSNQNSSSRGWESHIASANSDSEKGFQWGKQGRESFKKNRFEGSQNRGSNTGDWKNRNRPPRAPGQRLDLYSSEEQGVLKEIEPIMQSIRRIMQQQGYNDGDPLAAEDQLFVLENVFEHHPDKETKMGAGIDYVMVNRHSSFQDSRCFYVVLKDGRREDFSYRKCLDNWIRKKYPDLAESFVSKYFRKPRGRVDQTTTQGGDQTTLPGRDEAATPADHPSTPVPKETKE
ncbi:unnamed protein product [Sphenostylis stenocarpa]|uniref:DNA-directed RNA polymerase n=1 Tax=Sphenostylis stenocarpa TaxID=92480 RepID=A0AA87BCG9_9FABA|nr:unnamed protein product [Sphenostylis stenocarpa]